MGCRTTGTALKTLRYDSCGLRFMMSDLQGFSFSPRWFLGMIRAAPLQTGTRLNLVHAFGNRRPLIRGADGQRCPSLPSVCSQIDACAAAMLRSWTDGKHWGEAVVGLRLWTASWRSVMCILQCVRGMCIPEASLCKGDLHGTVGRGGWFQDRPLWAAPGDLRFLLTHRAHKHTLTLLKEHSCCQSFHF